MKFRNLAAAIAGIAFLAVSAFAQTATIEGNVIGYDGKPLANAVIKLVRTDIKANYQTKSDKKGHWVYMGLPPGGQFQISCEVDGKVVDTQPGRSSLANPQPVNFDLQKAKAAQDAQNAALQKAAESGGQITGDMTRGLSSEQKEALEKAVKDREAALKKNKELSDAYTAGMNAMENKQWPEAITAFEKATTVDANQTAIWVNLADAYLGEAKTKSGADREAEVQKGIEAYNKAIALKPDDAAIHNNYGRALAEAKKYPEAQAEMAKAAQLDPPGAGKYYYNLGAILVNIGQTDPAVEAFKKSIEADPNYADAYYQYGVSLLGKATLDASGKLNAPPGTAEAFQKCIDMAAKCQFAQQAKDSLAALGSTVESQYVDPNRKKSTPPSTSKTKK